MYFYVGQGLTFINISPMERFENPLASILVVCCFRGILRALYKYYKLHMFPVETCGPFLALEFAQLKVVWDLQVFSLICLSSISLI